MSDIPMHDPQRDAELEALGIPTETNGVGRIGSTRPERMVVLGVAVMAIWAILAIIAIGTYYLLKLMGVVS
jgi:hypothetical protein